MFANLQFWAIKVMEDKRVERLRTELCQQALVEPGRWCVWWRSGELDLQLLLPSPRPKRCAGRSGPVASCSSPSETVGGTSLMWYEAPEPKTAAFYEAKSWSEPLDEE